MEQTKSKAIAGYHLLMILSAVDGKFIVEEDMVISEWLKKKFPIFADLDKEMEILSALTPDYYMIHFQKCMDDFYRNSTPEERNELIQFAMDLIKADHTITKEENSFINELFDRWSEPSE